MISIARYSLARPLFVKVKCLASCFSKLITLLEGDKVRISSTWTITKVGIVHLSIHLTKTE